MELLLALLGNILTDAGSTLNVDHPLDESLRERVNLAMREIIAHGPDMWHAATSEALMTPHGQLFVSRNARALGVLFAQLSKHFREGGEDAQAAYSRAIREFLDEYVLSLATLTSAALTTAAAPMTLEFKYWWAD